MFETRVIRGQKQAKFNRVAGFNTIFQVTLLCAHLVSLLLIRASA